MQYILSILVIAILLVGGWYLLAGNDAEPMDETMDTDESMDETPMSDDGTIENGTADMSGNDEDNAVTIDLSGRNFEFDMSEIRVDEGDTITVNFTSTDGLHDFVIDGLDEATERVNTGETSSVTFVADEAGTFEFYCSVGNHREMGMVGTFIVE